MEKELPIGNNKPLNDYTANINGNEISVIKVGDGFGLKIIRLDETIGERIGCVKWYNDKDSAIDEYQKTIERLKYEA